MVNYQAVQGITHAYTACFCIENDVFSFLQITVFVKVGMTNSGTCFNDGHL